jgi:spore coat protein CotH
VTTASLEVVGVGDVPLSVQWSKWVGPSGFRIASGTQVVVHATSSLGQTAQTVPFRYLVDLTPTTRPCAPTDTDAGTDGGNNGGAITPGDVYDPSKVLTYELGFDAAALAILQSTAEADMKTWVHGTFKCGATVFADVGVRRKGTSTFRALPQKAAFKIRFNRYVANQYFAGFTDLTLNNSLSDPTFIAERLSYHVFRSVGLPAQRAVSAQVTINGAPWGLYVNVETPNEQLINRLFGANAKTLYEVNYGSEWVPGVEDGFEEDVGDGTFADVNALFNAVQAAQTATLLTDVAGNLNTTEWLKFSATEGAVGHYDGYAFGVWGSHNYFMAGDVNGRFSLIPWSTDLTMSNRETVVDTNQPRSSGAGAPSLLMRCKLSTTCWNAYKDQMKIVLAGYEGLGLVALAQAWHAQVHPLVLADPKTETSINYYTSETTNLYAWLAARPGVIRAQLGIAP